MNTLTFVVGILYEGGNFLAEQRRLTENYFPGAIIFPGGHIDDEEEPEDALLREMKEELEVVPQEYMFIGEFIHPDGAKNLTYLVTNWTGNLKPIEAERLVWVKNEQELTNQLDREMLRMAKSILGSEAFNL
jgi:8-oxo-dGTP diphosphatase